MLRGPVDVTLVIGQDVVRLIGPGVDVADQHLGVRPGLAAAMQDLRSTRAATRDLAVERAAGLLAESFLPPVVGQALVELIRAARAGNVALRLGVEVCGRLARLPWEALRDPDTLRPLALHPLINVYRKVPAAAPLPTSGPLRILIAIAAPDGEHTAHLDYQRELRSVLEAVRTARHADAQVRIVQFASTEAIRAALKQQPAHVLHLSGHGSPGLLHLEDSHGNARAVTADQFVDEAIPQGRMPPVIALAACHTDVVGDDDDVSPAETLCLRGASAVIATQTSITDRYSTWLFARVYAELVATPAPDLVTAVAEARRAVQADLATSRNPHDRQIAALDEWATVTVLAAQGSVAVFDPASPGPEQPLPLDEQASIAGLLHRPVGGFVGRRTEQRRWPTELVGGGAAGLLLHGIGGIGKTTLAAELVDRLQSGCGPWIIVSVTGHLSTDDILAEVGASLRRQLIAAGQASGMLWRVAQAVSQVDIAWPERFAMLRRYVLDRVPLVLVLDNFEDNLTADSAGGWEVADPAVAGLLATWALDPCRSRILVTSRYPFSLPTHAHLALVPHQLGPLTFPETLHLMFALPALDVLELDQLQRVWQLLGGHPRSLEYLDAVLSGGQARYPDITARLAAKLGPRQRSRLAAADSTLDASLAQVATIAADEVLLDELITRLRQTPGAVSLLIGASVYREAVDSNALMLQLGQPDEFAALANACVATSLLTHDESSGRVFVHRWTATELHRRWAATGYADEITASHLRAARYWRWKAESSPQDRRTDIHDLLEARHHLLQANDLEQANHVTEVVVGRLSDWGAWDQADSLTRDMLVRLPEHHRRRAAHLHRLGTLCHDRGDYEQAERSYEQALALFEKAGDRAGAAACNGQLGVLAQDRADYAEAERRYRQALRSFRELGRRSGMATAYHQLGMLAQERGDYPEAEHRYRQSLAIEEELGNRSGTAASYHQIGLLAQQRGDYRQAERLYEKSLFTQEELGNQSGMAFAYHQLGTVAQERGDYDEAERRYQQSMAIKEELGDRPGISTGYHNLGTLAHLRGDYAEAERRYRQSLAIEQDLGNRSGVAESHYQLAMLAHDRNDYREAEQLYRQALAIREALGNRSGVASSCHQLGLLAHHRGNHTEAERLYRRSLTIEQELGDRPGTAGSLGQLGVLAQDRGDLDQAESLHRQSLAIAVEVGNRVSMATSYSHLGHIAEERQRIAEAAAWHLKAYLIRAPIGVPTIANNIRSLRRHRTALGPEVFKALAIETAGDRADQIIELLDQPRDPASAGLPERPVAE